MSGLIWSFRLFKPVCMKGILGFLHAFSAIVVSPDIRCLCTYSSFHLSFYIAIQMCTVELLLSADPSLGRVDISLLSDQTLMEMFIEGFDDETKNKYRDNQGMYLDVCRWTCVTCNGNERVIEIRMARFHVSGSLELCYVPPKVKVLEISELGKSALTGSIDLTCLPDGMQKLYLNDHQFTGEIDLTKLPWKMQALSFRNNELTGSLVIKKIPPSMVFMDMRGNHFNAVAVLDSETDATIKLEGSGVTSVVDGNGGELDMKRFLR